MRGVFDPLDTPKIILARLYRRHTLRDLKLPSLRSMDRTHEQNKPGGSGSTYCCPAF